MGCWRPEFKSRPSHFPFPKPLNSPGPIVCQGTLKCKEGDVFRARSTDLSSHRPKFFRLSFLGFGRLASALASGLLAAGWPLRLLSAYARRSGVRAGVCCTRNPAYALKDAQVVVLAVKPKDAEAVLAQARPHFARGALLVSVAAGVSLKQLRALSGLKKVARAMPNVAAQERASLTALCFSRACSARDRKQVREIFGLLGETVALREKSFKAFTYASACGPAVVAYLAAALRDSFEDLGLPEKLSLRIARALLYGTASLADRLSFEEIVDLVKTKGGYTERLLEAFGRQGVARGLRRAYREASR